MIYLYNIYNNIIQLKSLFECTNENYWSEFKNYFYGGKTILIIPNSSLIEEGYGLFNIPTMYHVYSMT